MATTSGKKVTTGKKEGHHHVSMETDPPYYGDPETLKSAGARADDVPKVCGHCSVDGEAKAIDMSQQPGQRHTGWPEKVQG